MTEHDDGAVAPPPPPPPPLQGRRRPPLAERAAADMSAYDLIIGGESALTRAALRAVLASPARARTAVLAAEILGRPRSLRPYGSD